MTTTKTTQRAARDCWGDVHCYCGREAVVEVALVPPDQPLDPDVALPLCGECLDYLSSLASAYAGR
jgi:hypothetical protein